MVFVLNLIQTNSILLHHRPCKTKKSFCLEQQSKRLYELWEITVVSHKKICCQPKVRQIRSHNPILIIYTNDLRNEMFYFDVLFLYNYNPPAHGFLFFSILCFCTSNKGIKTYLIHDKHIHCTVTNYNKSSRRNINLLTSEG